MWRRGCILATTAQIHYTARSLMYYFIIHLHNSRFSNLEIYLTFYSLDTERFSFSLHRTHTSILYILWSKYIMTHARSSVTEDHHLAEHSILNILDYLEINNLSNNLERQISDWSANLKLLWQCTDFPFYFLSNPKRPNLWTVQDIKLFEIQASL